VNAIGAAFTRLRGAGRALRIRTRIALWCMLAITGSIVAYTATVLTLAGSSVFASDSRALVLDLLLALAVVLVIGWIAGLAVAALALSPVEHILQTTRALQPGAWNERLPQLGPDDELRDLTCVINELLDRVQASLERERRFADDVAHELRTPLTAQITRAEMTASLLHQQDSADPHEAMHSMLEEARHMQRLITGLLTLSRVATHSEAITLRPVDVVAVAEDCVELLRVLAEEKAQSLQVVHSGRPLAHAEPTMLRQALMNIVHNAIDHCGTGAQILVGVKSEPAQAGDARSAARVSIVVEDDGPGIAAEQLGQVFKRFFRGGQRRERRAGLGLGLAIAKALTEAQGGRIGVEPAAQRGTRFVLAFDAPPPVPPPPSSPRRAKALLRYSMALAGGDAGFKVMPSFAPAPRSRGGGDADRSEAQRLRELNPPID
jgi:signal transduction histidine kinase